MQHIGIDSSGLLEGYLRIGNGFLKYCWTAILAFKMINNEHIITNN